MDERLEGLRSVFKQTAETDIILLAIISVATVSAMLIIILHILKKNKIKKKRDDFSIRFDKPELDETAEKILVDLAAFTYKKDPYAVIKDRITFEKAVHLLMNKLQSGRNRQKLEAAEKSIEKLRQKLPWDTGVDADMICSTREIPEGTHLSLSMSEGGDDKVDVDGEVKRNCERYLEISAEHPLPEKNIGGKIKVVSKALNPPFTFESIIRAVNSVENTYRTAHTLKITDNNKRGYSRVKINMPVKGVFVKSDIQKVYDMKLHDISAGGMAIGSNDRLDISEESKIMIEIVPEKLVPPAARASAEGITAQRMRLTGRTLHEREGPDGSFVYGCQFIDMTPEKKSTLLQITRIIRSQSSN